MSARHRAVLLGLASLAALTRCGGGSVDAGDVLVVAWVEVTPPSPSLVAGSTRQLQATPKTSSGITIPNRPVSWSSEDHGIATVSTTGLVTAIATGSTRVSATVDGVEGSITVAVTPKPVASVSVVPSQVQLLVGETVDLVATARDEDSQPLSGRPVTFSSDNPLIATVSGDGHVVAVAPGLTVVRATIDGKTGTANIAVSARPAAQLAFQNEPVTGAAGVPLAAIRVEVQNDQGGTFTFGSVPVTISLAGNPTGAVLGGSTTVSAINGVAIFTDLTVNQAGIGYSLKATSGSLTPAESAPFAVVAGTASALSISTQPSPTGSSGTPFSRQPVIQVRDAAGNAVAKSGVQVTAALSGTGATLGGTRTVATNGEGVATFTNLSLTGPAGTYTLLFAAPGLTAVASNGITLLAPATTLAIVQQPAATAQSGVVLTRQPAVQVQDAEGKPVPQSNLAVIATIETGGGSLGGTTTVLTDANGRATFADLSIGGLAGTRTLRFEAAGVSAAFSENVAVSAGPASRLIVATNPPPVSSSGAPLVPGPAVQVADAYGNPVDPDPEITVTATLVSGPGTLGGTTAVTTTAGGAAFPNLVLTGPTGSYTISFSGGGLTPVATPPISIGVVTPTSLAMATQPSATAQSGTEFAQQPVVQVRDGSNNPAPVSGIAITASILTGGGTLSGTTTRLTNSAGEAVFTDLAIAGTPGPRTLQFTATGLTAVTSSSIEITQNAPAKLEITTAPAATAQSGVALTQQPVLALTDGNGAGVPGVTITASINSGPAGASLAGATALTDASGNATFTDLTLTGPAGDYTLKFATGGLTAISGVITIAPEVGKLLLPTPPAATAVNGVAFATQPAVQVADANGSPVAQSGKLVTAVIASGPAGGTLTNATATTDAAGLAQFSGLTLTGLVGSYTLRFESAGFEPVTTAALTLSAGAPAQLTIPTQPPLVAVNDAQFGNNVVVRVQDASGNNVPNVVVTASLASGAGIVKGTLARTTGSNGRATFNDLELVGTIGVYTLAFSVGDLSIVSRDITLRAGARASLAIQVEPSVTAKSGVNFATQPKIELRDTGGNLVDDDKVKVNASLVAVSGVGSLGGDTSKETNNAGVASFSDLRITGTGTFRIRFTSSGLTSVTSVEITVTLL